MKLIGTHNSATGEKSYGILSKLVALFAKTQNKTIVEQYKEGCRLFDIRVKLSNWRKDTLVCAHGLWETQRTAEDILKEINSFKAKKRVMLIYEGNSKNRELFETFVEKCKKDFNNIDFCEIAIKFGKDSKLFKPKYDYIYCNYNGAKVESKFVNLNGKTWHTFIPIPILWKKIYFNTPKFNDKTFFIVDFL